VGVVHRCRFVRASAGDLSPIESASVDAVTTRSVLIYVEDKAAAFREFYRVLRPQGRISLFEPINRFAQEYDPDGNWWGANWWGTADTSVATLGARLREHFQRLQPHDSDPMMDFDHLDLLRHAEAAGFRRIDLRLQIYVMPSPPMNWTALISSPGNPTIPSMAEAMDEVFTPDERVRFEAHVRPIVERGGRITHNAVVYLQATKEA
jgi:SAM-dependent methyltransferase